jgi:SPOR domain
MTVTFSSASLVFTWSRIFEHLREADSAVQDHYKAPQGSYVLRHRSRLRITTSRRRWRNFWSVIRACLFISRPFARAADLMNTSRAICFLAAVFLVACSSTQRDWEQARARNTVASYRSFLDKHPNTAQSVQARNRIQALQDEQAWAQARQANTDQALEAYLQQQPSGMHVAEAKGLIGASERWAAWIVASSAGTTEALESFLEEYPQGPEAKRAKADLAQITGYRVQLASFRSEQQAEKTRDLLQGKYGDVLGSVEIVPVSGTSANVHVVRSAPMGQDEANNACAKLKKAHQTCEVIRDVNS